MRLSKSIFLFVTLLLVAAKFNAQDKLLFLNGKLLEGKILNQTAVEFSFQDKKNKQYSIDKYRVFSYTKNEKERVVYKFDTLSENFLSEIDMRHFVYGEKDAHQTYRSNLVNIVGAAVGGTAGYFMHKDQSFFYAATPFLYTIITLPFGTKIHHQNNIKHQNLFKEDEYLRGYDKVARSKRTTNALKFSFIGVAAGYVIGALTHP